MNIPVAGNWVARDHGCTARFAANSGESVETPSWRFCTDGDGAVAEVALHRSCESAVNDTVVIPISCGALKPDEDPAAMYTELRCENVMGDGGTEEADEIDSRS